MRIMSTNSAFSNYSLGFLRPAYKIKPKSNLRPPHWYLFLRQPLRRSKLSDSSANSARYEIKSARDENCRPSDSLGCTRTHTWGSPCVCFRFVPPKRVRMWVIPDTGHSGSCPHYAKIVPPMYMKPQNVARCSFTECEKMRRWGFLLCQFSGESREVEEASQRKSAGVRTFDVAVIGLFPNFSALLMNSPRLSGRKVPQKRENEEALASKFQKASFELLLCVFNLLPPATLYERRSDFMRQ